jgi:hypothetical protein
MGKENLLWGPPEYFKIGDEGAEEAACTDVGYTDAGLTVTNSKSYIKRRVDQVAGAVKANLDEINKQLKVTFAEASLDNIRLALGLPSGALAAGVLSVGANEGAPGDEPVYYCLYFKGPGPTGGTRHVWVPKCYIDGDVPIVMSKSNGNIELTFELIQDVTQAANEQWYKVTDATGDTTAPTVTETSPTDPEAAFAVDANVAITFSERIQAGYINDTYFKMIKVSDGTAVAGALSVNAAGTIVTFNPTENLSAGAAYLFVVSKGIRDMQGNALAADTIINITTAGG